MEQKIRRIAEKLAEEGPHIVFTGAGISTESGIPDYRSKGGIWESFRPIDFQAFMASKEARIEYWRRKSESFPLLSGAEPNPAHLALARLYDAGRLEAVITQNIDGLHQRSGIPDDRVVELHGSDFRIRCMSCRRFHDIEAVHRRVTGGDLAPECECGGYLKQDTISFGQNLDPEVIDRASALSRNSRVFIVVGSTLVVQPAALMPAYAKQNGAFLAIITLSETPYDGVCDVLIAEKAGTVLPQIVEAVDHLHSAKNNG